MEDSQAVVLHRLDEYTFFAGDTLLHEELPVNSEVGVAGSPIPYSVRTDDIITSLLLFCFIFAVISIATVRGFIVHQIHNFFYQPTDTTSEMTATASEMRFQVYLVFLSSLLIALLFYFYMIHTLDDNYLLDSPYYLIAIFLAILLAYYFVKMLVYTMVNHLFFDGKKNVQWIRTLLFLTALEVFLYFPLVVMRAYFALSMENVVLYFVIVLIFVKLLTFYKCFIIFFRRNVVSLQIILYFCALEIMPMLVVWTALVSTANYLKINY